MSEIQKDTGLSLAWELGLYIFLIFSFLALPFYNDLAISNPNNSQIFLFLDNNPVFGGEAFEDLVNFYFIILLLLLVTLPILAFFIHNFFEKRGYPFLASLQSLLIHVSCVVMFVYAVFSLSVQKDHYSFSSGFYVCLLIYLFHIYSNLRDIKKMIEYRNSATKTANEAEILSKE